MSQNLSTISIVFDSLTDATALFSISKQLKSEVVSAVVRSAVMSSKTCVWNGASLQHCGDNYLNSHDAVCGYKGNGILAPLLQDFWPTNAVNCVHYLRCVLTNEAVMKKFHGNSVPRPRMKKIIPTKQPLWMGNKSCYLKRLYRNWLDVAIENGWSRKSGPLSY